jgi:RNA polymerase sigma factor (sigma-70 family)
MTTIARDTASPTDEDLAGLVAGRRQPRADSQRAAAAFDELYERYAGRLIAYLSARRLPGDLEDLHQAVWVRVWDRLPPAIEKGRFAHWLFTTARRVAVDEARAARRARGKVQQLGDDDLVDPRQASPDERSLRAERVEAINAALKRLKQNEADVLRTWASGDLYDRDPEKTGGTAKQSYQLAYRAKTKLRAMLRKVTG